MNLVNKYIIIVLITKTQNLLNWKNVKSNTLVLS